MPEPDPTLYVTASGIVHRPECQTISRPNVYASPWSTWFAHDRGCLVCLPDLPTTHPTSPSAQCRGEGRGTNSEGNER